MVTLECAMWKMMGGMSVPFKYLQLRSSTDYSYVAL